MQFSRLILLSLFFLFCSGMASAQVQGVFVERYYVSDALDSTDVSSGGLPAGSVTFRVYVDLADSSRIIKISGSNGRPLNFSSSQPFFNHFTSGVLHPYSLQPINYQEFTVGLDSWITLGQVARRNTTTFCGVVKDKDSNGNYFAGVLNDGGMLSNNDPSCTIPLTQSDGMDTMRYQLSPSSWGSSAFPDSSVFGPLSNVTDFSSEMASLQCDGARGNDTSNMVLVAQLTTAGDLHFDLNVDVVEYHLTGPEVVSYVYKLAPGEVETANLKVSSFLSYPPVCGCTDPRYVEYGAFACSSPDSCKRLVVYGCTDTAACNYDPTANFNLPSLCCYPGFCNDRNLTVVCPELNFGRSAFSSLDAYPNPFQDDLAIQWSDAKEGDYSIRVFSTTGALKFSGEFSVNAGPGRIILPVQELHPGMYLMKIAGAGLELNKLIVKQ
jgi:hypothetical protein